MKFQYLSSKLKNSKSDAYVLPCIQEKNNRFSCLAPLTKELQKVVADVGKLKDFSAKKGECCTLYHKVPFSPRVILVGLGEESSLTGEDLREEYAKVLGKFGKLKLSAIVTLLPAVASMRPDIVLMSMMEGMSYGAYCFSCYKKHDCVFPDVQIPYESEKEFLIVNKRVTALMKGVNFARDTVNMNANEVSPQGFADLVLKHTPKGLIIEVYDEKWIAKEKMGLLLAVGQGSAIPPRFMTLSWQGNKKSKEHTVLVGKGITFDSGGMNLKPTGFIENMRDDMSGAAAVTGVMFALAELKADVNVTAVIPLAENSIGSASFKPGDVYRARAGDTVEITNTDAEGRLVLADAVDWAVSMLTPTQMIDVATLTGACERALGPDMTGLFSNSDDLACKLDAAALRAGELFWRFPLHQPYKELLASDYADVKNSSSTAYGGAITGALFIERFVKKTPWAHLDIAGTSFHKDGRKYYGKGGTGTPVRTLLEFILPVYI